MSRLLLVIYSLAFTVSVFAQTGTSSLTGVISGPNSAPVADAPIQVTNKSTGSRARTASKPDGGYALTGLAAGTYQLTIVMPCCAYNRVAREIVIEAGKTTQFDIALTETVNGTTLG